MVEVEGEEGRERRGRRKERKREGEMVEEEGFGMKV